MAYCVYEDKPHTEKLGEPVDRAWPPAPSTSTSTTTTTTTAPDADGDGVPDDTDICPNVSNPRQIATDVDAACRFIDNDDGTIMDTDTGKMWLKDMACLGTGTWDAGASAGSAQKLVADLNAGTDFTCAGCLP